MLGPALAALAGATCLATPVRIVTYAEGFAEQQVVRAGPFVGFLAARPEVDPAKLELLEAAPDRRRHWRARTDEAARLGGVRQDRCS